MGGVDTRIDKRSGSGDRRTGPRHRRGV